MINAPKKWRSRTIFVSNHPSAFLDPLLISDQQNTIVHFMVRSDVFKPWLKPVTWACQMLPIYRSLDGEGAVNKNQTIFNTCYSLLKRRRSLLLFGEGFTDDVFIRRLKPMKKGPVRIAFGAMEKYNWDFDLNIVCVGINYTDPNHFGGDVLLSYSEPINVNAYKEKYLEKPEQVLTEITKRIGEGIQEQITHLKNKKHSSLHENIMKLTRKGMSSRYSDKSISMEKRWKYSQNLAHKINSLDENQGEALEKLDKSLASYFSLIKKFRLDENYIHEYSKTKKLSTLPQLLFLILFAPLMLVGLIHSAIPYLLAKKFVEGSFKRKVFWGGVKMMMGKLFIGLYNIPFIFLFYHFVYPSYGLAILHYFTIPVISGIVAYNWFKKVKEIAEKRKIKTAKIDLMKFVSKRESAKKEISELIGEISS